MQVGISISNVKNMVLKNKDKTKKYNKLGVYKICLCVLSAREWDNLG